ncbi:MAG: hypothetical protein K2O31_06785, partial [Clostridia bacterium]|nr:hypothetical protein [Clostridia bacterium]
KHNLPYVAYNQGSIVHLECTGAMSYDFSSKSMLTLLKVLKKQDMIMVRKVAMEHMGAAYMANGIVTLAGSRLYTSMADTDEVIEDALNRFDTVFGMVEERTEAMDKQVAKYKMNKYKGVNDKKYKKAEKKLAKAEAAEAKANK